MDPRHRRLRIIVVIVALIVGACGSATTSAPTGAGASASPAVSPVPPPLTGVPETISPSPSGAAEIPAPAQQSTPAPKAKPVPAPTPAPVTATKWTKPRPIGTLKSCSTVTAGIDVASRYHVVAECAGSIHYYESTDGRSWKGTAFAHPAHRADLGPQLAFKGEIVYVGYTRIAPDGDCGGYGQDIGVYFRSRTQPHGAWSAPVRIGQPRDRLQSFRVEGQTVHATVRNASSERVYYETLAGSTFHRYRIPGAIGRTSLRVGSDGRARIAYETSSGMRFATFTGSGFATTRIVGSKSDEDVRPALVLDSGDDAHVVWTRKPGEGGCVTRDSNPDDGTYYSTNAGGSWTSHRITKAVGETSLQVDATTGRVHVLVSGQVGIWYFTKAPHGPWTAKRVVAKDWVTSPVVRLDPATGKLLIVYLGGPDDTKIYAMTKP